MGAVEDGWSRARARLARGSARSGLDWMRWLEASARRVLGEGVARCFLDLRGTWVP